MGDRLETPGAVGMRSDTEASGQWQSGAPIGGCKAQVSVSGRVYLTVTTYTVGETRRSGARPINHFMYVDYGHLCYASKKILFRQTRQQGNFR